MFNNFEITNEKLQKARIIEGMLGELGMSKQELVDLIKNLLEQNLSQEVSQPEKQAQTEAGIKELLENSQIDELPSNLKIEDIAKYISEGNIEFLSRYLSLEDLKKILVRVNFALSYKRAKDLGILQDEALISQLLEVPGIEALQPDGSYKQQGKREHLGIEKTNDVTVKLNDLINQRQLSQSSYQGQQVANQLSQYLNDPNSLNNPNSSVNVVKRVMSNIRMQVQQAGGALSALTQSGTSQAAQRQQQQQQMQNMARNIQRTFSQMRRHDRKLRNMFPEIKDIKHGKNEEMFAKVKTNRGEKEVNLKDYLKSEGKLSARAEKAINLLSQGNSSIIRDAEQLSKGLPDAKSFQFSADGRFQLTTQEKEHLKTHNVTDYVNEIKQEISKAKQKIETKKAEVDKLDTQKSNIERTRELSRGPELDKSDMKMISSAAEREAVALKLAAIQQGNIELATEDKSKEKKESKRMSDELVKLDALHDRQKVMESLKTTGEMKKIEASMKNAMKDMAEAEKNKDLLEEIKKGLDKNRTFDKN